MRIRPEILCDTTHGRAVRTALHPAFFLPALVLSSPLWLFLPDAAAGVFKWVDEEGKVHYGDAPPAQGDAETVRTAPPPSDEEVLRSRDRLDALREQTAVLNKAREEREKQKEAAEREEAQRKQRCLRAQTELGIAQFEGGVFHWDEQGNRVYMEDDEREAQRARARKDVDKFCR